jgi:glycosyltransferase involved in cell wall biosynthesis
VPTPFISVIFVSYQQKAFVGEALRSILQQDYPAFEVIIGDDGSQDGTREVIAQELARYRGPAKITFFPATANLGLKRNINRCVAAAQGEIMVMAAGDDVSQVQRLSQVAVFFAQHPKAYAVYHNARIIGAQGELLRAQWYKEPQPQVYRFELRSSNLHQHLPYCGATASYRAPVLKNFPPLMHDGGGEDNICALRALLLGEAWILPTMAVDWRWHGANISHGRRLTAAKDTASVLKRLAGWALGQKIHRRAQLRDLDYAAKQGLAAVPVVQRARQLVEHVFYLNTLKYHCTHPHGRWGTVWFAARKVLVFSPRSFFKEISQVMKAVAKKLLPPMLRAKVLNPFNK